MITISLTAEELDALQLATARAMNELRRDLHHLGKTTIKTSEPTIDLVNECNRELAQLKELLTILSRAHIEGR